MLSLGACVVICVNNVRIVSRSARRSDDIDATSEVAAGFLAVGSALILSYLFADARLSPSARERVLRGFSRL